MINFPVMKLRFLLPALCAVAVLAAPSTAGVKLRPGKLLVSNGDQTVRGTPGSYCLSSEPDPDGGGQSVCADVLPPTAPPRPRLVVEPGGSLTLRYFERAAVRDEIDKISASLLRFRADGSVQFIKPGFDAEPAGDDGSGWTLTLPKRLKRANDLSLFVRFEEGDAFFDVGLER